MQAFEGQCCVPCLAFWKHPGSPHAECSPGSPQAASSGDVESTAVTDLTEQLTSTEQLLAQLKELVREKDAELRSKDLQLKVLSMCSCQNHCLKSPFSPFWHVLQASNLLQQLWDGHKELFWGLAIAAFSRCVFCSRIELEGFFGTFYSFKKNHKVDFFLREVSFCPFSLWM